MSIISLSNTLSRRLSLFRYDITRGIVKVGDKVPVNYIKDAPPVLIKPDSDYPDWVFTLTDPHPTKEQLLKKVEATGVDSLTMYENNRLRRLIRRETILLNNSSGVEEEG